MIYLILAFLCSTVISTIVRVSEKYVKNNITMFMVNYVVCLLLALFYKGNLKLNFEEPGLGFAILVGSISGVLFLAGFVLLQFNIKKNGVVLSATFMKLGLLVPIIMAITVFHEQPGVLQIIGCILAIAAIFIVQFDKSAIEEGKHKIWLVVLLLVGGISDSMTNVYDKVGNPALKEDFLLFIFVVAVICAIFEMKRLHQRITRTDVLFGVILGVPNYYSTRFLLLALSKLPAVLVYPAYSVATLLMITVIGVLLFKEKMTKKKWFAFVIILVAIVMMNV